MKKDNRITYTNQPIEVNGTVVHFDGKLNPETKELRVYKIHGDVTLFDEALQNFCLDNGIDKALTFVHI